MAILGRILLVLVAMALVVESAVAWNLFDQARTKPREPITVGERVERSLTQPSPITQTIDVVLQAPIDAPTPADRMPPPLHPSHRKAMQQKELAQTEAGKSAPLEPPEPAVSPDVVGKTEAPAPKADIVGAPPAQRPMPPPAPAPRPESNELAEASKTATKKPESPKPAPAGEMPRAAVAAKPADAPQPGEPKLETLPEAGEPNAAEPPMPKSPVTVAANVPAPDRPSPFTVPKPERPMPPGPSSETKPENPRPAIPPFERPALGEVTADPARTADAARRLTALGATVSAAIDREGREMPGRYAVSLDPNPNGDAMTRLNLQLQNQLGRALADMGDSLHTVSLRNLGLGNLAWVSNCPGLVSLDLTGSNFLNIEPLTRLPRLETLNVARTHVDNMILASMIRNLRVLNLSSAGVVDINPLGNLQGLEELYLSDTRVGSIEAVARMPRLAVLDISGTRVTGLRPLASCPSLRRLGLARTRTSDLAFVASCPELVGLDLSGCEQLQTIDPLAGAKKLENLSLFGVPVESIEALSGCESLQTLELSRTAVRDISPLAKAKRLREIHLRALALKTPGPLTALPELTFLDLTGTTFEDSVSLAAVRKALSDKGVEVTPEN